MSSAESMNSAAAVAEVNLNNNEHLLQLAKVIHAKMPEDRRLPVIEICDLIEGVIQDVYVCEADKKGGSRTMGGAI